MRVCGCACVGVGARACARVRVCGCACVCDGGQAGSGFSWWSLSLMWSFGCVVVSAHVQGCGSRAHARACVSVYISERTVHVGSVCVCVHTMIDPDALSVDGRFVGVSFSGVYGVEYEFWDETNAMRTVLTMCGTAWMVESNFEGMGSTWSVMNVVHGAGFFQSHTSGGVCVAASVRSADIVVVASFVGHADNSVSSLCSPNNTAVEEIRFGHLPLLSRFTPPVW